MKTTSYYKYLSLKCLAQCLTLAWVEKGESKVGNRWSENIVPNAMLLIADRSTMKVGDLVPRILDKHFPYPAGHKADRSSTTALE